MRSPFTLRAAALASAAISLAACAVPAAPPGSYDPAIRTEVDQQLAQTSARAANALETLAMIQRTRTEPAAPVLDDASLPAELRRKATVEFTGPAIELVRELAQNLGYAFIETGNQPANPGLVTVDAHDTTVAKVLEDTGLQAQRFATVVVDPNQRRIEFRNETAGAKAAHVPGHPVAAAPHGAQHRAAVTRHRVVVSGGCSPCAEAASAASASPAAAPSRASAPARAAPAPAAVPVPDADVSRPAPSPSAVQIPLPASRPGLRLPAGTAPAAAGTAPAAAGAPSALPPGMVAVTPEASR